MKLRTWIADGAHRRDRDGDGRYQHTDAIRILDAFCPRWMRAQFEPSLGAPLCEQLIAAHELDDEPNNHGDPRRLRLQTGWYGYAYKDLRRVLGLKVPEPYAKRYCGGGRRARWRSVLRDALTRALEVDPATMYRDAACAKAGRPGDQRATTRSSSARRAGSRSR